MRLGYVPGSLLVVCLAYCWSSRSFGSAFLVVGLAHQQLGWPKKGLDGGEKEERGKREERREKKRKRKK